jgi:hypothetical protein
MRLLLQVIFTGFAIIEVEQRIERRPQAESGVPEAIQFHSERSKTRKTAFWTVLNVGLAFISA